MLLIKTACSNVSVNKTTWEKRKVQGLIIMTYKTIIRGKNGIYIKGKLKTTKRQTNEYTCTFGSKIQ